MFNVAIITASDKGAQGEREDISGQTIRKMLEGQGLVRHYRVVPDDKEVLIREMKYAADEVGVDLILTTGGTGLSVRDVTPEATLAVIERQVPGIPEGMRMKSLEITAKAMLSRAVAGTRGSTLIINLPGSPKGAAECLAVVLPIIEHGVAILKGEASECARS